MPSKVLRFVGGGVALVLLLWAAKCQIERTVKNAIKSDSTVTALKDSVRRTDSVFVADTFTLRVARTRYDTLRRQLVITDTVRVKEILTAADATIKACTDAVSSCANALRARDSLIKELQRQPYVPRITYPVAMLYELPSQSVALRGGPELRLFWGLSAIAEGEVKMSAVPSESGFRGAIRVGVQKRF